MTAVIIRNKSISPPFTMGRTDYRRPPLIQLLCCCSSKYQSQITVPGCSLNASDTLNTGRCCNGGRINGQISVFTVIDDSSSVILTADIDRSGRTSTDCVSGNNS